MFQHIKNQRPLEDKDSPIALVMTPTRESAEKIHRACKPFLKALGLRGVCACGASPIKEQMEKLNNGAEIIICTPGRMTDLLTACSGRVTNLRRVSYVVIDEADGMKDVGVESQVMRIVNNIRHDRQIVFFSDTLPRRVDDYARRILRNPLRITVGLRRQFVVPVEVEGIVDSSDRVEVRTTAW